MLQPLRTGLTLRPVPPVGIIESQCQIFPLRKYGKLAVINTCTLEDTGKTKRAKGVATPVEGTNNSKLKVKFAPEWVPFASGDYWILHLEPDYSAALVGSPDGKYLWILARNKTPGDALLEKIKLRAEELGYETEPLLFAG
ncbi:lipocalin family protein [Henriciella pelagia]|jgi:apolipoprotein D and lipocalin family protein|uniref:Lipocalin/cytosolic fatty-acid binding domain-containing protein n=1 Tax=Henriciella pelagia TaxID=1977912 RepID=A0ABQ1JUB1_9PROT|nr:lipocalin family protein [Henriciella pelagia]GGB77832.1 hypothetical protein GCM10011503_28260 [Henriciella pelagia]